MDRDGAEADRQVAGLLAAGRRELDLSVAFVSRIDATTRTIEHADSALPHFRAGWSGPREGTHCAAGPSSLRNVVVTNPDVLEMDRSIVNGLDSDPIPATLAQSLVEFAHSFDVRVIAEGVETQDEHAVLQTLGVDGGQGWSYGRPGPADLPVDEGTRLAAPAPFPAAVG